MSFIQALFLLGGLAVAGPIAAHFLARPRYRRVPFTMLRFLQTGEVESQSRRRLHNLLILLLRCTAILLIALFFAGPERILAGSHTEVAPALVVAIDDSLSMAYKDHFERARGAVSERIANAPAGARLYIVTLASGESLQTTDVGAARQFLAGLQPIPLRLQATPLFSAIDTAVRESGRLPAVFMASDFTSAAREALAGQTKKIKVASADFSTIAPAGSVSNSSIAGVQLGSGEGDHLQISVLLANNSPAPVETTLSATLNSSPAETIPVILPAQGRSSVQVTLPLPDTSTPYSAITLALAPGDGLMEDDTYYFGLARSGGSARRIVIFANDRAEAFLLHTALTTLAEANPLDLVGVEVVRYGRFTPNVLAGAQVAIFASPPPESEQGIDEIVAFVRGGGRLVAFANGTDAAYYAALAKAGILPARPQSFQQGERHFAPGSANGGVGGLLKDLRNYRLDSLPVSGAWLAVPAEAAEVLWTFDTGEPFVCRMAAGRGDAIFVNTSANDTLSPLMKSPAAVAFASFLAGGASALQPIAFEAGDTMFLPASEFEIEHARDGQAMYVTAPSGTALPARLANGSLVISRATELGMFVGQSKPARYAGVNAPRGETDLAPPPEGSVETLFNQLFEAAPDEGGAAEDPVQQGRAPLWRGIAWLALALLFAELFLSNRMDR